MAAPPEFSSDKVTSSSAADAGFRRMTFQDLAAVMRNERSAYSHPWTEGIFRNCLASDYENWVMDCDGQLLGHAVLSFTLDEAHLLNICVVPERQGHGLGRRLLDFVIQRASTRKATGLFLEVRASNDAAIHLYESTGFREIGRRRGYYPARRGREDALVMLLPLADEAT